MKKLACIFRILALILSHTMCIVVASNYCNLWWSGRYGLTSFPTYAAFFLAIPYLVGIAICIILAIIFQKRAMHL